MINNIEKRKKFLQFKKEKYEREPTSEFGRRMSVSILHSEWDFIKESIALGETREILWEFYIREKVIKCHFNTFDNFVRNMIKDEKISQETGIEQSRYIPKNETPEQKEERNITAAEIKRIREEAIAKQENEKQENTNEPKKEPEQQKNLDSKKTEDQEPPKPASPSPPKDDYAWDFDPIKEKKEMQEWKKKVMAEKEEAEKKAEEEAREAARQEAEKENNSKSRK